jgi:hypothetical protein
VLYLKDADSIAGMLLLSRLVEGCRVWSALSKSQGTLRPRAPSQGHITTTPANSAQKHGIDILHA